MSTKYLDLFRALAAPIEKGRVKTLTQAGRELRYITARTVMNRLDDVLGPSNWWDDYTAHENSVLCRLTIRLPDGSTLTKADAGGFAGMADQGDDDKSGYCLPLNAEALTRDGWREYHQLSVGQDILAFDPGSGLCRWTPLQHITVFDEPCPVVQMASKSFHMICTPQHRWVVNRRDKGLLIKETRDLDTRDAILNAAPAEGGAHPLTPREAAILGWLATDGCVTEGSRASEGRRGKQFHATIHQSKEPYRSEIRALLSDDATEFTHAAGERVFPGHAVASAVRERSAFRLNNTFAKRLLAKAGIVDWCDLIGLVSRLSVEARECMFKAMLDGDGHHSPGGQVVFGKKSKPGVMEAFEILATLQGVSLGAPRWSTVGDLPIRTLRKLPRVKARCLSFQPARPVAVWCPTTAFGTWVTRWNGTITITGNSDGLKRAAVKFGIARELYGDGVATFPVEKASAVDATKPAVTRDERSYWELATDKAAETNDAFRGLPGQSEAAEITDGVTITGRLLWLAWDQKRTTFEPTPNTPQGELVRQMDGVYKAHRNWVRGEMKKYLGEVLAEATRKAGGAKVVTA